MESRIFRCSRCGTHLLPSPCLGSPRAEMFDGTDHTSDRCVEVLLNVNRKLLELIDGVEVEL